LHICTGIGETLQIPFPILGIHDVGGLFAPLETSFIKGAKHPVLLIHGVEEGTDMILPCEIDPRELY
jgi:hypothetical protein